MRATHRRHKEAASGVTYKDDERLKKETRTTQMKNTEERHRRKIWELGVKNREMSGRGRTKETKLFYKSVALILYRSYKRVLLSALSSGECANHRNNHTI